MARNGVVGNKFKEHVTDADCKSYYFGKIVYSENII